MIQNLRKIAEELIWYGGKTEDGRWPIFINLDFDYTITCKGSWVSGKFVENPGCFEILKRWEKDYNCKYCLNTMRTGEGRDKAVKWCRENGLEFFGIGRNPYQEEEQVSKTWGVFSIDDINAGSPLIFPENGDRAYVDWKGIDEWLTPMLSDISVLLKEMEKEVLENKEKVMQEKKAKDLKGD